MYRAHTPHLCPFPLQSPPPFPFSTLSPPLTPPPPLPPPTPHSPSLLLYPLPIQSTFHPSSPDFHPPPPSLYPPPPPKSLFHTLCYFTFTLLYPLQNFSAFPFDTAPSIFHAFLNPHPLPPSAPYSGLSYPPLPTIPSLPIPHIPLPPSFPSPPPSHNRPLPYPHSHTRMGWGRVIFRGDRRRGFGALTGRIRRTRETKLRPAKIFGTDEKKPSRGPKGFEAVGFPQQFGPAGFSSCGEGLTINRVDGGAKNRARHRFHIPSGRDPIFLGHGGLWAPEGSPLRWAAVAGMLTLTEKTAALRMGLFLGGGWAGVKIAGRSRRLFPCPSCAVRFTIPTQCRKNKLPTIFNPAVSAAAVSKKPRAENFSGKPCRVTVYRSGGRAYVTGSVIRVGRRGTP